MKKKLKEAIVSEILKTTFSIVVDDNHPAGWWATGFAGEIRDSQGRALEKLIDRIEKLFEKKDPG